jgi:hypothetical protein
VDAVQNIGIEAKILDLPLVVDEVTGAGVDPANGAL